LHFISESKKSDIDVNTIIQLPDEETYRHERQTPLKVPYTIGSVAIFFNGYQQTDLVSEYSDLAKNELFQQLITSYLGLRNRVESDRSTRRTSLTMVEAFGRESKIHLHENFQELCICETWVNYVTKKDATTPLYGRLYTKKGKTKFPVPNPEYSKFLFPILIIARAYDKYNCKNNVELPIPWRSPNQQPKYGLLMNKKDGIALDE